VTGDFRDRLAALAEAEDAPPSTIDALRARADGRRRMLRTRAAGAGAAAVIVAVALAVAALTAAREPSRAPANPVPSHRAAVPKNAEPVVMAGTDPLIADVEFGWLPDGFAQSGFVPDDAEAQPADGGTTTSPYVNASIVSSEPTHVLDPTVSQAGKQPWEGALLKQRIPVAVLGSPKAYWVSNDAHNPLMGDWAFLVWQLNGDRWGILYTYHVESIADWQHVVPRIASQLRLTQDPIAMPFHIQAVPDDFGVVQASYRKATLSVPAILEPVTAAWVATVQFQAEGSDVWVTAEPAPPPGSAPDAHASVTNLATASQCADKQGVRLCVDVDDGLPRSLVAIGGIPGLLARLTSMGADPAGWTTKVLGTQS
jgi:hypothetical protein